jgi:hypothetical protein
MQQEPRRRILEVRIQPWVTAMNRMPFFSRILMLLSSPPVNRQNDPASIRGGNRFFLLRRPLSNDSARGSSLLPHYSHPRRSPQSATAGVRHTRRVHGLVVRSAGRRSIP